LVPTWSCPARWGPVISGNESRSLDSAELPKPRRTIGFDGRGTRAEELSCDFTLDTVSD
jgi:hypothetical protein